MKKGLSCLLGLLLAGSLCFCFLWACDPEYWWPVPDDNSESPYGTLIFTDDFEQYDNSEYPDTKGWYNLWSGSGEDDSFVVSGLSHSGTNSFNLNGLGSWIRADGLDLDLTEVEELTYQVAVMIPAGSATTAKMGFFEEIDANTNTAYNQVRLNPGTQTFSIVGETGVTSESIWEYDTWYVIRVTVDYVNLLLDAWVDDTLEVEDLEAKAKDVSNIFFIATRNYADSEAGSLYFDDVSIWTK